MKVGERIREFRIAKGWTQKELAFNSGLAEITIRQYEKGKRTPKTKQLQEIASVLDVSINELLGINPIQTLSNMTKFLNYLDSLGYEYIPTIDAVIGDDYDRGIYIKDESITIPFTKEEFENLENEIMRDVETEIYKLRKQRNL